MKLKLKLKLTNLPLVLRNLALVAVHQVRRSLRRAERAGRVGSKHALRRAELVRKIPGAVTEWGATRRVQFIRGRRHAERFEQHVLRPYRQGRRVARALRALAATDDPIIVGPWISEVGYEVLYWVPFLRWFADRYGVAPERLIAVSRGGVQSWYHGVASRYLDLLTLVDCDEFARGTAQRRSAGDQKQLESSPWERQLVSRAADTLGLDRPRVLHPGLMYQLFRSFWYGDRSLDFLLRHTDYQRMTPPPAMALPARPREYAVIKFYNGAALPDTPQVRARLRELVALVTARMPVVMLDAGFGLDEHEDYLFRDVPGVTSVRSWLTPERNLEQQTAIVAGARLFVGTCGSLAWLAPMLGVDTLAVYEDDRFLTAHLYAARYAYRQMNAARFSVVDLRAVNGLSGWGLFEPEHEPRTENIEA